ncbi:MAG: glycosyltransferase family 39 protein [Pseudomonadota bacterium]
MAQVDVDGLTGGSDNQSMKAKVAEFFRPHQQIDSAFLDAVIPGRAFLIPALIAVIALKIVAVYAAAPLADEGYYWLWGKNLDWSYYDHPPLGGWVLALTSALLGDSLWAIRSTTIPVVAGIAWIIWFWVKALVEPKRRIDAYLTAILIFGASPWMMQYTSIVFHDYLLIGAGIAAAHFFALFLRSMGAKPAYLYLYTACLFLGLAGLAKYSGVLIGFGFGAWVLCTAKGRTLLSDIHLWCGAVLAMLMQAPVIYWNMVNDWPSFRYNLHDRIGDVNFENPVLRFWDWGENYVWMLSPVLMIALVRYLMVGSQSSVIRAMQGPGRFVFWVTIAVFTYVTFSTSVFFYWMVTSIVFFMPVAFFFFKSAAEVRLHLIWGIVFCFMQNFNMAVVPVEALAGKPVIKDVTISHGLDEVAAEFAAAEQTLNPDLALTTDYRTASLLSLTMQRTDVMAMGYRVDMFDFWFEPAQHQGADALVLVYDRFPETELITKNFETVTTIREFTITRYGADLESYKLVYAQNYSGEGDH